MPITNGTTVPENSVRSTHERFRRASKRTLHPDRHPRTSLPSDNGTYVRKIGLTESISIAVGGGIFAVLGVVATTAGTLTWLAFVASGVIAICAGYSFVRLNDVIDVRAGPITYVGRFTGNAKPAGTTGWTFLIGYVGTMSLYADAFAGYFVELAASNPSRRSACRSARSSHSQRSWYSSA